MNVFFLFYHALGREMVVKVFNENIINFLIFYNQSRWSSLFPIVDLFNNNNIKHNINIIILINVNRKASLDIMTIKIFPRASKGEYRFLSSNCKIFPKIEVQVMIKIPTQRRFIEFQNSPTLLIIDKWGEKVLEWIKIVLHYIFVIVIQCMLNF